MKDKLTLSRYNSLLRDSKENCILYNSRTNSLLKIPEEFYSLLKKNTDLEEIDPDTKSLCMQHKIFVKQEEDETYYRMKKVEANSLSYSSKSLCLTILPTSHCNFCCEYCFETNKTKSVMSDQTIDDLIRFINDYPNNTDLQITWFGGEPLLGQKQIRTILSRIKTETHVKLKSHTIVTNGYCLNNHALQIFKEHPLDRIQITIDGTKEHHDQTRILKNGKGTFDVIINNLKKTLKELPECIILVRVNINQKNKEEFPKIWNYFQEEFKNDQNRIHVYPGIIKVKDEANRCWTCDTLFSKERSEFYYELNDQTMIPVNFYPSFKSKGCIATMINGFVIGSEGEIYKCWNEVGNLLQSIGNIHSPEKIDTEKHCKYIIGGSCFEAEECRQCTILPICHGGCPRERISNLFKGTHFELCSIYKDPRILAKSLEIHYSIKK